MDNAQYCPNANVRSNHLKNYKLNWNGANLTSYANTVSQLLARIAILVISYYVRVKVMAV